MSLADQYREAYITFSPNTIGSYMNLVQSIDPSASLIDREGQIWIVFSDNSEWQLGAADQPATKMRHHDS